MNLLFQVYRRQFEELAGLRRHLFGRLPLRRCRRIVDPGCGTGLLLRELGCLTDAERVGLDRNEDALVEARRTVVPRESVRGWGAAPEGGGPERKAPLFRLQDVTTGRLPEADLYISSFFLYQLPDPAAFLERVRRRLPDDGLYAVAGEYEYNALEEDPRGSGLRDALLESFRAEGFHTDAGSRLAGWFEGAGFRPVQAGIVPGALQLPDRDFLRLQLGGRIPAAELEERLSAGAWASVRLAFPVHWGIYRR